MVCRRDLLDLATPILKMAAAVLVAAAVTLAILNNVAREEPAAIYETAAATNQTVVYRREPARIAAAAMTPRAPVVTASISTDRADEGIPYYPRAVQTVRFTDPNRSQVAADGRIPPTLAAVFEPEVMTRVSGFVAFSGKESGVETGAPSGKVRPDFPRKRGSAVMAEVDDYLWEVYQREPTKKDRAGDFTWKDPAAAKRLSMALQDYVIGGMDPDFREQLYHAGKAMDAAGIQWSILSGFRDDYRQRIASGFKARTGNSLHGGSRATGGYGHGRAVDVMGVDNTSSEVWQWLDANGAKYGLFRPIPGPDPAHVQSRGEWRKIAVALRDGRVKGSTIAAGKVKAKVIAKAGLN
jgi:hypothetical protein